MKLCKRKLLRKAGCHLGRYLKCKMAIIIITSIILSLIWLIFNNALDFSNKNANNFEYCQDIDVVYTWVNGSDPEFIASINYYAENYDVARFDDKNELLYSLRSLEMHAPWVRHVYIVTNGQIPHWLDLNYEKVTIVPHEVLVKEQNMLPTFSSAAIETFLHRIPNLSERFLYMNDDIFLGSTLYPEDLYTQSEGVRIYQAWMVPDCANDCPWTYIGDGACDKHCNIVACQFDGNDCLNADLEHSREVTVTHNKTIKSFKLMLQQQNSTALHELRRLVTSYNKRWQNTQTQPKSINQTKEIKKKPIKNDNNMHKDIYSQSLIYTNMLLNTHYGFKARNVMAHVGFLLERQIIEKMQEKFAKAVEITAKHRFRAAEDLQFAFAYYAFIMSENREANIEEIFHEFDTDESGTWSDREIRTFLARMYPLPLDWSAVRFFEEIVGNCTHYSSTSKIVYATLVYERYEDSNLPTVTLDLVKNCAPLAEALVANFGQRSTYKYNINAKRASHSNFIMLTSNISDVVDVLDKLRLHPRKFNCVNDNLNAEQTEDNMLVRQLLEDFYLSFFPKRSKFELLPQYRNRFANWHDYQRWKRRKRAALATGYTAAFLLIAFLLRCLCLHKAKIVRRYIQKA